MPKVDAPVEAEEFRGAPHADAASAAQERRVSEQLITDWEQGTRRLGDALTRMTVDVAAMAGPKWVHRFIIAVSQTVEDSTLVFCGAKIALLLKISELPGLSNATITHLPARYVPVFAKGCIASALSSLPIRMHGTIEREDGEQELYRAAFIRWVDPNHHRRFAFGAFNCRTVKQRT
jgi:hypothetical protein